MSLCKRTIVKSLDTATATTVEILTTSSIRFEFKKDRISWNADAFEDKLQIEKRNYKSLHRHLVQPKSKTVRIRANDQGLITSFSNNIKISKFM